MNSRRDARKLPLVVVDWRDVAVDFDIRPFRFSSTNRRCENFNPLHAQYTAQIVFAVCAVKPPGMPYAWGSIGIPPSNWRTGGDFLWYIRPARFA